MNLIGESIVGIASAVRLFVVLIFWLAPSAVVGVWPKLERAGRANLSNPDS
jgi:hypothetical protein